MIAMRRPGRAWALAAVCATACSRTSVAPPGLTEAKPAAPTVASAGAAIPAAPRVDAHALLERFECARCHEGTGLAEPPLEKQCIGCHQRIIEGRFEAPAKALARWRGHLRSLIHAPSLAGIGRRLRRDWVQQFLLAPCDLRPALPATMPRLGLNHTEAQAIAAYLIPAEAPATAFTDEEASAGGALFRSLGCSACHAFTGSDAPAGPRPDPSGPAAMVLAPDLALTRDRFQPGALAAWLRGGDEPGRTMPTFPLDEAQARALAAYVLRARLSPRPPPAIPSRLPPLTRTVGWHEVEIKVFRKVCWHCHSTPDYALGDGGPGNTGGFGFAPRGLDLGRLDGVLSGSIGDDGRRRSVFAPLPDATPRLVAHLLARQHEEAGQAVPGLRGMPLGLPSLTAEEIQLVETWIVQGHPR
jgi:mono/diheme cytochrome c family protein